MQSLFWCVRCSWKCPFCAFGVNICEDAHCAYQLPYSFMCGHEGQLYMFLTVNKCATSQQLQAMDESARSTVSHSYGHYDAACCAVVS
jgi:hypothetical protein